MYDKKLMYLRVLDRSGAILFEGPPAQMPFPQETILKKCLQYYNDPEPCHIRRGAVILRMAAEIQQAVLVAPIHPTQGPWREYFTAFSDAGLAECFYP